ncbi:MAG: protein-glutamate methylesterase/protein-glutamine glutaminase [Acidobacteriaceae bacterium]
MKLLRVLVVDDSVVMRTMMREALSQDPDVAIAGVAANGKIALSMLEQVTPDAVTLDIDMPEMDGLETLKLLRERYPKLPVVMFSALSEKGAASTLDALAMGADDYVTKPSNVNGPTEGMERIRSELLPKLKALCGLHSGRSAAYEKSVHVPTDVQLPPFNWREEIRAAARGTPAEMALPLTLSPRASARIDVVAIGTSTGGPNALAEVVPLLPKDLPVPVVIVQHMPPTFTRFLAERLNSTSAIPVVEASAGDRLEPGKAWIAPGDFHMTVRLDHTGVCIGTNQDERENSCRPSVDVLFRSVAEVYGANTLAVVMTGMGQDGLRGCEHIKRVGGQIIVQDEASSVVWGMPGFIAKAGLADRTLPLAEIGGEIVRRVSQRAGVANTY